MERKEKDKFYLKDFEDFFSNESEMLEMEARVTLVSKSEVHVEKFSSYVAEVGTRSLCLGVFES